MLIWTTSPTRSFASYAAYFLAAWSLGVPLVAQSQDTADSTEPAPAAPASPTTPPPPPPPSPEQTSAVSTASDSAVSAVGASAVSSAVGLTPSSGPGAPVTPVLGDHLGSAYTSDRIPFRVSATLSEVYADNIFAQPQHTVDYITRLTLRGDVQFGNLLTVDGNYFDGFYYPSLRVYARHSHEDGVDQDVDVLYAHHFSRLTLSLEQIYSSIQSTDAAVGGLVTRDIYTTIAKSNFAYSSKLDLVSTLTQEFTNYDVTGYTDTREWSGQTYALYHLDDKVSFGFGPRIGYLILKNAPDEHYQQVLARVIYVANDKLTVQGAAGGEEREFQTAARSDALNPIFEMTATYLPYPSTNIVLYANRRYTPSYNFVGEDYIATRVNLTAAQRFFRVYYLGLQAGYENDDYQTGGTPAAGSSREDNYYYLQPTLSWKPNAALDVAVFDRYEEDDSNIAIFAYNSNQVGVSVTAIY